MLITGNVVVVVIDFDVASVDVVVFDVVIGLVVVVVVVIGTIIKKFHRLIDINERTDQTYLATLRMTIET